MAEWQNRPVDRVYPVVFIDAVTVKIREGQVANRPIYVVMAVTVDGHRDILGIWAGDGGEGAKHWLHVLTELKNRGVADVLMLVCDGLKGLPDAARGGVAAHDRADLCDAPEPSRKQIVASQLCPRWTGVAILDGLRQQPPYPRADRYAVGEPEPGLSPFVEVMQPIRDCGEG